MIAVAEPGRLTPRPIRATAAPTPATTTASRSRCRGPPGQSDDPDLVSTELVSGGDSDLMTFTYDGQIDPGSETSCYAITSTSTTAVAENILVTGANTLQVEFGEDFSLISELVVGGADSGGCVLDANSNEDSTQGAKPAGGNVGAQATGYGAGPDAQALTINRANDTAQVTIDQRVDPDSIVFGDIFLVGPNGGNITSPSQITVPTQGPGPQNTHPRFRGQEIPEGTVGIRFDEDALDTFDYDQSGSFNDEENVTQVFAP